MNYKEQIEKMAENMPYVLQNGNFATPRGWESDDEDVDDINQYIEDEDRLIPSHLKPIASDGFGNVTLIDPQSDKANPDYYDWDHETQDLVKWDDKRKAEHFSVMEDNEMMSYLRKNNIGWADVKNLQEDELSQFDTSSKLSKGEIRKAKAKAMIEGLGYTLGGALIGGTTGAGLAMPEGSKKIPKVPAIAGTLIGGTLGGAIGYGDYKMKTEGLKNTPNYDDIRRNLRYAALDNEMNDEFIGQYKNAQSYQEQIEKMAELSEQEQAEFDANRKVLADSWKENVAPGKNLLKNVLGVSGAAGGAGLLMDTHNKGLVDGRRKLFHNTNNENVQSILDNGIIASRANDDDVFTKKIMRGQGRTDLDNFNDKVYLAKKKIGADSVGSRRMQVENSIFGMFAPNEDIARQLAKEKTTTMKASVPFDEYKAMKHLKNPETAKYKNFDDFLAQAESAAGNKFKGIKKLDQRLTFNALDKGTVTLGENFDPKYLKGSKHYQKQTAKELGRYIKNNPGRFAKGLGAGALGAGLAVGGATAYGKSIVDQYKGKKKHMEENKAVIDRQQELYNKMWGL